MVTSSGKGHNGFLSIIVRCLHIISITYVVRIEGNDTHSAVIHSEVPHFKPMLSTNNGRHIETHF